MLKGLVFKLLLSELLPETEWSEVILIWWFVSHYLKSVHIRSYSGPHFPAFGMNREIYGVSRRIQSKCGKMRTRITPNMDTFHAVLIKIGRSFFKLTFLIYSNDSPCNFNFTGKNCPISINKYHYGRTGFFLLFFSSERYHLLFSFVNFLNKIVEPKFKTLFSKLLKGYICYIFLLQKYMTS